MGSHQGAHLLYQMLFQQIGCNLFCASQTIGERINHQGGTVLRIACSIDRRIALMLDAMRALDHNGANPTAIDNLRARINDALLSRPKSNRIK